MNKFHLSLISLLFIAQAVVGQQNNIEVPLRFDKYYTYEEVNQALVALNKAYPKLTRLKLVGQSEEGREI